MCAPQIATDANDEAAALEEAPGENQHLGTISQMSLPPPDTMETFPRDTETQPGGGKHDRWVAERGGRKGEWANRHKI